MQGNKPSWLERPLMRVILSLIAIVVPFLLRQELAIQFGVVLPPFTIFYLAILIVALSAGLWPGVLATAFATFLVDVWVFPPIGSPAIVNSTQGVSMVLFFVTGVLMSVVAESYRQKQRKIAALEKEKALHENEEKHRNLFEALIEGFCVIEVIFDGYQRPVDYQFLEVNPSFEKQTGLRDVKGKLIRELVPDHEAHWFEIYGRVAQTGEPTRFENEAESLNRWFEGFAYRIGGPESRKVAILFSDITERKQAQDAILRSETLASLGRMSAAIAKEIDSPLNSAAKMLYQARVNEQCPKPVQGYLKEAEQELSHIAELTRRALGFYRESNTPALVRMNTVLQSAMGLMKHRIRAKRAVLDSEWNEPMEMFAVASELRQVFCNLLANSLDAIDEHGTVRFRMTTGTDWKSGQKSVRIVVADNGRGISKDLQKRIFEPFYTTKETVGTGLGLWFAKQVVAKHLGTISVRSNTGGPRRGTIVLVVLPLNVAPAGAAIDKPVSAATEALAGL
jgi:PAS domain S-box-containing protein